MNTSNVIFSLSIIMILLVTLNISVYAEENSVIHVNISSNNSSMIETPVPGSSVNQTGNISSGQNFTDPVSDISESVVMYSGIEHPDEETDVKSSTPEGNPLIPKYAQGGVSVDIMGHLMEARGNDTNVSADITFHDHTDVNGYISTLIKDFHYMSSVDTES